MSVRIMHDVFRIVFSLSVVLAGAVSASAQDVVDFPLAKGKFKEVLRPGAEISGSIIVGVQVHVPRTGEPVVRGFVPKAWANEEFCARVVSANGLYEASNSYEVSDSNKKKGWNGVIGTFQYDTEHDDTLGVLPKHGLAILVSHGACETSDSMVYAVGLWNTTEISEVDIIVNSFRADSVFAYIEGRDVPIACDRLEIGGSIAFDTRCSLDTSDLSGSTKVQIYRLTGGKPAPPTDFEIVFPVAGE